MLIHITAYMLYLVSLIYFFFTSLRGKDPTPQIFLIDVCIRTTFSSLSQILLSYVFWSIHKMSVTEGEP